MGAMKRVADQFLTIGHFSLLTLSVHDVRYESSLFSGTYSFLFTCSHIALRFHLPTRRHPRWFTFSAKSMFYTCTTADISVSSLDTTLWAFPLLLRQTAGPWANVVLDGLRIRVYRSNATPEWIRRLRENLIGTICTGEILRLDDFWTNVELSGLSDTVLVSKLSGGSADHYDGGEERVANAAGEEEITDSDADWEEEAKEEVDPRKGEKPLLPVFLHGKDEMRMSAFARQLHLHNTEARIYTFGRVDAQLRRDWNEDKGSFVMVAEEARWVRVHWTYQREVTGFWTQLFTSLMQFPLDLSNVLRFPMGTINLYVTRADITFDEFRIRDAELIKQAFSIIREKTRLSDIPWGDVFFDALVAAFAH
ncbi:hypothetical protein BKA93DRAFT_823130 [Sparassis latifolia]